MQNGIAAEATGCAEDYNPSFAPGRKSVCNGADVSGLPAHYL